jgi:hypothetical protein
MRVEALHQWWAEMHLPAINLMIHRACLLLPTVQFETVLRELTWPHN